MVRDKIIKIYLPSDTVRIIKEVKVKNGTASMQKVIREFGIIKVSAWINDNLLTVNGEIVDSTVFYKLDSAEVRINSLEQKIQSKSNIEVKTVKVIEKTGAFYVWFFWIFVLIFIIWVLFKLNILKFKLWG